MTQFRNVLLLVSSPSPAFAITGQRPAFPALCSMDYWTEETRSRALISVGKVSGARSLGQGVWVMVFVARFLGQGICGKVSVARCLGQGVCGKVFGARYVQSRKPSQIIG